MRDRPDILIVGAGIGGLALALALQRAGLAARVCERAPELREIGAGLLLTPNATWVLDRLGVRAAAHAAILRRVRIAMGDACRPGIGRGH